MRAPLLLLACGVLAACSGQGDSDAEATATEVPRAVGKAPVGAPAVESSYGTPVAERVATLGMLNKRNNLTQDIVLKPGESRRVGNLVVRLATCERTLPWERPQETGAFVQVFVEERARSSDPLTWRKVFSGWLFRNSPSLNVVEHPVYDVWVKDCAMKFPGEEETPSALASNAPKAAGKPGPAASGSPVPAATTPPPSPSPTPDVDRPADNSDAR